jgi:tetratricopeptide (TPR) repeat protein
VIFAAGLMGNPTPLARRALAVDPALAFEIVRDAPRAVPEDLTRQLAETLWSRTIAGGGVTGRNRFWAILFRRLAALVGKTVEGLAADVDGQSDENAQINHLMAFYAELGDAQGQARALSGAVQGQDVPESLLFGAAVAALYSADHQRAVDLYTRFIEKNPRDAAAHHNRALAYENFGRNDAALADYERAIELEGLPYQRTNYARLLHELGRKDEALREVRLALEGDPNDAWAHRVLARFLESEEPETALGHCEQAVRYALHDEDLRSYLPRLAVIQEKLGRHAEAIRTLRWMIALEPTSAQVKSWKQRIAALRQRLDAEIRAQSARQRLHEQGELPLPTLVVEWLRAAGLTVEHATSGWVLAKPRDLPSLPVLLMPEARVTGRGLREAVESVRAHAWQAPKIVVVTAAETLDLEAHHQWAAMQDEVTLALISALEVRDALLQSDRECRALLDRVLGRSGTLSDPFDYRGVVREPTEFFGRRRDLEDLTARISRGQQVGLYGIHKIGKSSLLEQLRRTLHVGHPEITVLRIELDGHGRGPGDFYHRVLERLPGAPELPSPQSLTSAQFRRRLGEYQQARAKQRPAHRVLLMVDEYPFLIPDTRGESHWPGYLEVLGQLKTLHQEGWFLLLPCGRSAALNRQGSWPEGENPLVGLLHPLFLGPLPREENDALMTTIGLRAHLKFTPEALEAVYAQTAGHPSLSRGLGSQIADAGTGEVTEARVHAAVEKFLRNRDRTTILRAIYEDRMDRDEQQIARTLAIGGARARKDLFPEDADTPRRRQIRDAVENLLDTTVLVQQPDEKIAHRYGLLGRMIQEEARELGQE